MAKELTVAVVAGVLAFTGAISGDYISSRLQQQRSDRQFTQQFRAHILDLRMQTIESCTHARSRLPWALQLKQYQDPLVTHINTDRAATLVLQKDGPPTKLLDIQRELNGITAEYIGCLQDSASRFGPKTHSASEALKNAEAWNPEDSTQAPLFNALNNAMIEEAMYFGEKGHH